MRGWRGLLAGVLGLSALYAVIRTEAAAGRVGGLVDLVNAGLRRLADPKVAGVGNHTHGFTKTGAPGSGGGTGGRAGTGGSGGSSGGRAGTGGSGGSAGGSAGAGGGIGPLRPRG
ncbi:MAG TPA: hypothetical protein VMU51_32685 [Mycobacteriales bacterium]|nr:hypothetical protein [Mycobacteriales bacterium]